MSKKEKLNEGMFDFIMNPYRSIRGAIRGGTAGYGSAVGSDNKDQAKDTLMKEAKAAWEDFAVSLKKAGYSVHQITDMKDAFEANLQKLIDYAIIEYFP